MGARGRKSKEQQESNLVVLEGGKSATRLAPPSDMTARQQEIWREIVASEPVEFFDTAVNALLLKDLCRHRERVEIVSRIIDEFEHEWIKTEAGLKRWNRMVRAVADEQRQVVACMRTLRLTNQSRYTPHGAATAARHEPKSTKYPWES